MNFRAHFKLHYTIHGPLIMQIDLADRSCQGQHITKRKSYSKAGAQCMLMCYLSWYDKPPKKLIASNSELNKPLRSLRGKLSRTLTCSNKLKSTTHQGA